MRFIDSNVFVYAFLKPRRKLSRSEERLKSSAKGIVARINAGEKVLTSVVHLAEIANILEDNLRMEESLGIERALLMNENIDVAKVSREDCIAAVGVAEDVGVGMNDAVAHVAMRERGITELYSFDKDFDSFHDVKRFTE